MNGDGSPANTPLPSCAIALVLPCINPPSGKFYRWECEKKGQEVPINVPGVLTLDSPNLMIDAALDGLGIAYVSERSVRERLADGALVPLLADWCPPIPGLCLYYSGHRHVPAGLRAFIDILKDSGL